MGIFRVCILYATRYVKSLYKVGSKDKLLDATAPSINISIGVCFTVYRSSCKITVYVYADS